ncbi:NAD(P)H-quinone oxidoreductase subunit L, chloroplastic [Mangifera indica]|uniref:NAD(P)H-quinone oxidoreductase subunit L, chloroplastic n=1 Tax=Mangifera indica TaxID=29780 RepID=UPI001CF966A4|nr:NAD(P)H-quinone oxidoreductase subunit L, chloroplastic [Mangifera indica]
MSCTFTLQTLKALPCLSSSQCSGRRTKPAPLCNHKSANHTKLNKKLLSSLSQRASHFFDEKKSGLAVQIGALLWATFEQPAIAVTGENNYDIDLNTVIIKLGIIAVWYFLIMPPIIMNWLRVRWYRRNLLEMYLQFMFVFLFFPGLLLWAPFLNFRRLPRDPSMKYPWSTPEDPSKVKNYYLKFPWAEPEDYDL